MVDVHPLTAALHFVTKPHAVVDELTEVLQGHGVRRDDSRPHLVPKGEEGNSHPRLPTLGPEDVFVDESLGELHAPGAWPDVLMVNHVVLYVLLCRIECFFELRDTGRVRPGSTDEGS